VHAKLRAIVDAIHARGVVHNDLRGHENVLLDRDGELTVVDFAAAIRLRPGGIAHRLFFRLASLADEAALLKWKGLIAPGSYTQADEAFLRRFERWRAIWPFNAKRRKAKSRVA
jgi:serine/threonine protein kinase